MEKPRVDFYPLVLDDGGRNFSKRPSQTADCSVRAFSIVSGLPYDEVYDILQKAGRKPCQGFHTDRWVKRNKGKVVGGKCTAVKLKVGKIDLTPNNFVNFYPKGRFVLESHDHTWAVIDGVHRDMWRVKCPDDSLFGVWKFTQSLTKKNQ